MNLGMSRNFGTVDLQHLTFPTTMRVDWVRVYQPDNAINIGCDPKDFPTQAYINKFVVLFAQQVSVFTVVYRYIEAYTNPNLTSKCIALSHIYTCLILYVAWIDDYKQPIPKSKLVDGC